MYVIPLLWIIVPALVAAGFYVVRAARGPAHSVPEAPWARRALVFSIAALIVDALVSWMVASSNSDMAWMFLWSSLPLTGLATVLIVVSLARREWKQSPRPALWSGAFLAASVVFLLSTPFVWALVY